MNFQSRKFSKSIIYTVNKCKLFEFITRKNVKNKGHNKQIQNSKNFVQS